MMKTYASEKRKIVAFALAIISLIAVLLVFDTVYDYTRTVDTAKQRLDSNRIAVAEHASVTFKVAESALYEAHVYLGSRPLSTRSEREMHQYLKNIAKRYPQLGWISVQDSADVVIFNSDTFPTDKTPLSYLDYPQYHRQDPSTAKLFFSKPAVGAITKKWRFFITRRLSAPDGSYAGNVGSALVPSYFDGIYKDIVLGSSGRITLIRDDGQVLMQTPLEENAMRADYSQRLLFTTYLKQASSGCFRSPSAGYDSSDRFISYQRVGNYPVIATVSMTADEALLPWKQRLWIRLLTMGFVFAGALWLGWLLWIRISESERAEAVLRESEAKFRFITERMSDVIWTLDANMRVQYVSPSITKSLGLTPEERIEQPLFARITPESLERVQEVLRLELQHDRDNDVDPDRTVTLELEYYHKNGSTVWHETAVRAIRDDRGNIIGYHGASRDITERKKSEESRRAIDERYQQLVQFAPTAIYEVDFLQNKLISVNDALCDYTGYSREELLSMNPFDILTDESKVITAERFRKHLSGEKIPESVTLKIKKKNGQEIWAFLNSRFILEDGRPRGAHVVAQDISERMRAEQALRESEEKYRAIIENMDEGYIEVDLKGHFTFFNEKATEFFGYSTEEMMGMHYKKYTDEETSRKIFRLYNEIYRTGIPKDWFEWEAIRKDGSRRTVEGSASLILDTNGQPAGFRSIFRDVTERRHLEDRLQRAEKMEALGTLAGGVAHDLNNVLGVLVGYSELLMQQLPEDSPLQRHAMRILNGGERAAAIIQDLLTLTRRAVTVSDVVNLNKVISEFLQTPEVEAVKAHHPGVIFKTALDPELLNMKGSPTHLGKTVMNLLSNAAEAITGMGEVLIKTENRYVDKPIHGYDTTQEGEYAVLTVSDTGSGISPKDIGKIFEPFYTKKVMGRSGTGLGLAVVWGTVKDHDGYIDVESKEGKGTTFTLYFPVTREALSKAEQAAPQSTYMGRGEHILVVDDVEGQRHLATTMLEGLGYKVSSVASGEEAIEFVKQKPVDLLILDMIMDPGIDGLDTYRGILDIRPQQKAIIVSGFSESDRVHTAQALGAGAYVRKPYVVEKLGLAVRTELDRK